MRRLLLSAAIALLAASGPAWAQTGVGDAVSRGEYVFHAAGCYGCHTDVKGKGAPLAGGRALPTPFGTFFGPNITPDTEHGIGDWTLADFTRALREGVAPDGRAYYPAFPYTSFTGMTEEDISGLWAYLQSVTPVARKNQPHALSAPFGWRPLMSIWRMLYFMPRSFEAGEPPDGAADGEAWRRGAYLVSALGHCGECHTPRGALGAMRMDYFLTGARLGPKGDKVPNLTPDPRKGLGEWSGDDMATYLEIGMLPDGDFAGGEMVEVIEHSTGKLTPMDRAAIVAYLRSLPPVAR